MNYLFTNAPLFVPGMKSDFNPHDLERRIEKVEGKQGGVSYIEKAKEGRQWILF
jgi:hypothetical protein